MPPDEPRSSVFAQTIQARGHASVVATHPTTFEVTKERSLTQRGDCVLAVAASKGPRDLDQRIRDALRNSRARVTAVLAAGGRIFVARGYGHEGLSLTHPAEMVFRRSRYVSDRTVMLASDKAASDVPRDMVLLLKNPDTFVELTLQVSLP